MASNTPYSYEKPVNTQNAHFAQYHSKPQSYARVRDKDEREKPRYFTLLWANQ